MSQRDSGYERKERDLYETPEWVTEALIGHLPFVNARIVWEPACGSGKMLAVLRDRFENVRGSDIETGEDFLQAIATDASIIITNPPYSQAYAFVMHALRLTKNARGCVAMLLSNDWDSAKGRAHLFTAPFAKKLVLNKRIVWFERKDGKKAAPSENHSWFIWDWRHSGPPTLAYGP